MITKVVLWSCRTRRLLLLLNQMVNVPWQTQARRAVSCIYTSRELPGLCALRNDCRVAARRTQIEACNSAKSPDAVSRKLVDNNMAVNDLAPTGPNYSAQ